MPNREVCCKISFPPVGNLYEPQGNLAEAEKMFQRVLDGYERFRGPAHTSTKRIRRNLSNLGT
jgi:hypothetical protein